MRQSRVRRNRVGGHCGFAACLLAVLVTAGGHWVALQSVAWAFMFADFARQDSVAAALNRTFDGRHPCRMCLQIRQGQKQEQQAGAQRPCVNPEKMPELFCGPGRVTVPPAPAAAAGVPAGALALFYDFIESPPKPPPRAA